MDRSGRRTAVIAVAIAVGVLFGGAPVIAAPAAADQRGGSSNDPGAAGSPDGGLPVRTPARSESPTTTPARTIRGPGRPEPVPPPPDPCPWLLIPTLQAPPRNSQIGMVIGLPAMPAVNTVPVFGDGRIPGAPFAGADGIALEVPGLPSPASPPVAGPIDGTPVPSALVAPSPVVPPAVPVVAAPPAGPPARNVPNLPAPGLVGPVPAEAATVPAAPRLPETPAYLPALRPDDLGRIASSALPGLAVLGGMTLLGGAIGYRQARAGYVLRAAGAGRFLQ